MLKSNHAFQCITNKKEEVLCLMLILCWRRLFKKITCGWARHERVGRQMIEFPAQKVFAKRANAKKENR